MLYQRSYVLVFCCLIIAQAAFTQTNPNCDPGNPLILNAVGEALLCNGDDDGNITLTVSGGIPPYTYQWNMLAGTVQNPSNLAAGVFTVTVTDSDLCTGTTSATITQPASKPSGLVTKTDVSCFGVCDGTASVAPFGGTSATGNYLFLWDTGQTTQSVTGICPGIHGVTITDDNNCSTGVPYIIPFPPNLITVLTPTPVDCNGNLTGSVDLQINFGGTPPFTFLWNNGSTVQNPTGLAAGIAVVTVTDVNTCSWIRQVTVTEPAVLTASATGEFIDCSPGAAGTVSLTVNGGTMPYTYLWSTGGTDQNLTGLGVGNYNVTVTDNNNCVTFSSGEITGPVDFPTASVSSPTANGGTNISCAGGTDGEATVTASGGLPPYSYLWNTGATTPTITGLSAGSFSVTVQDANVCETSASIVLSEPVSSISLSVNSPTFTGGTNISCQGATDGEATVTASGGTMPYTYSWSDGQTDATASGLGAGFYTVTVTDLNSCAETVNITLTQPLAELTLSLNSPVQSNGFNLICPGDSDASATALAMGGTSPYTYSWSDGQTGNTATGLIAGPYILTVSDVNACVVTGSITITEPPIFDVMFDAPVFNGGFNLACEGDDTGTLTANASGGNPPYTYDWSTGQTANSISNLGAGTYAITISDALGCTLEDAFTMTQPASKPSASVSTTDVTCFGTCDGSATATPFGGTVSGPYGFLWDTGATTAMITGLCPGIHGVTISDDNGCATGVPVIIPFPPNLIADILPTDVLCNGGSDGSVMLNVTFGGTPPFSYLWSNGSTEQNPSGLSAGDYFVTITDVNSCPWVRQATIGEPTALSTSTTGDMVDCTGNPTGVITLNVAGGTTPYTFLWSNGSTDQNLSGVGIGTFDVTVTDANACTITDSDDIVGPADFPIVTITSPATSGGYNTTCPGDSDASATVAVTGGIPPYVFTWSTGETTTTITGLSAGPYNVTVVDGNVCSASNSITITEPPVIDVLFNPTMFNGGFNLACEGDDNGTLTANASGGNPPYMYEWATGQTVNTISNLDSGTYAITVTDNLGCTQTDAFTMTQPASKPSASVTTTDVTCFGTCDGSATATPFGGTVSGPYGFLWDTGATTAMVTGLCPGIHGVTISDDNGCSTGVPVVIPFPPNLLEVITPTDASCNGGSDGSATLQINFGGTPPFTFVWSNGSTEQNPTGLSAGTYLVTISDVNSCPWVRQTTIGEPTAITSSTTGDMVNCVLGATGTITLSANGGTPPYSYLWNTGSTDQNLAGVGIGLYTVTITDNNGCTATDGGEVIGPDGFPVVMIVSLTTASGFNIACNGDGDGSATASAVDGLPPYSFTWNTGATTTTITGLSAGPYSVTVVDANLCSSSAAITLTEPPPIDVMFDAPSFNGGFNLACEGDDNGTLTANISGGNPPYTYEWATGQTENSLSNLDAGTYAITITDSEGCAREDAFTMTQPSSKPSASVSTTDVTCFGTCDGTATASPFGGTVSGPYGFLWETGATTAMVTGLCPGIHGVTISDDNGCSTGVPVIIPFPPNLMVDITPDPVECFGDATGSIMLNITFGGTPPFTYSWSGGAGTDQNPTGIPAGVYTVSITDANMCLNTRTVEVSEPPLLTAAATGQFLNCTGGTDGMISLVANGGIPPYTYSWDNGAGTDQNPSGLSSGTYTVTVTDSNGCTETTSTMINEPTNPPTVMVGSPQNPGGTNISCQGAADGSATATAADGTPPYTYSWSDGQTDATATGLAAGTFTVTVTDTNGCEETASIALSEPMDPVGLMLDSPTSQGGTNIGCNGEFTGSANASASGGTGPYTFAWSDGQTDATATGLGAGTYIVTVTDVNGCEETSSIALTEPMAPVGLMLDSPTSQGGTNIGCNGEFTGSTNASASGGTGPYTFAWSDGQTDATATGLGAGTFSVTVTDVNGCEETSSIALTEPMAPVGLMLDSPTSQGGTNIGCNGEFTGSANASASGGTGPYTFAWSDGQTDATATGLGAGTFSVTVTDVNGCEETSSIALTEPMAPVGLMLDSPTSQGGTNIGCNGEFTGSANASASGGTGPYTFAWSDGQTDATATGLGAGTFSVTVTDVNGCEETSSIALTEPMAPVGLMLDSPTSQGGTNIGCNGEFTGSANASASGGTGPYTFAWSDGQTDATATGLGAGTFSVTVTDVNGCEETSSIALTEPMAPVGLILDSPTSQGGTNIGCNGEFTGSANASASGGTGPYTFAWSDGQTDATATGLGAGTFSVTVTDVNGCEETSSIALTEPMAPVGLMLDSPTSQGGTNIGCNGEFTGSANASASGGTGPYTFAWSDGQTDATATGLGAGTFSVTVTDVNGCEETSSIALTEPMAPVGLMLDSPTSQGGTNIGCNGEFTGSANASASGGTGPYTFAWSDGQTDATATGLGAGTFSVTVTDVNGCEETSSIALTEPMAPVGLMLDSPTSQGGTNIGCNGEFTGSANASASGGTGPYTFAWSDGQTDATATGLGAGTYIVTVTDVNGCEETSSIALTEPMAPVGLMLDSPTSQGGTNIGCNGEFTGSANASASGGTGPYTFAWSDGQTDATATGLGAGTFSVTVTDVNGCEETSSIALTEPMAPVGLMLDSPTSQGGTNIGCNGEFTGSANASASGGTGPYTFAWSDGQTDATATGLGAGTYIVTVTDVNGCEETSSIALTEPMAPVGLMLDSPTSQGGTNIGCNGEFTGSANASASGGTGPYTFAWSDGQTDATATGLGAGTYIVTVTDVNGCEETSSIALTEPMAPVGLMLDSPTSQGGTNIGCNGEFTGSANASASGGTGPYTFAWSDGQTDATATGLGAGTFSVTVTDVNGCEDTADITLTEPAGPIGLMLDSPTSQGGTNIGCNSEFTGSANASASGGTPPYTYTWSDGQTGATATGLASGTYTVTATDVNGCEQTADITLSQPAESIGVVLDSPTSQGGTNIDCNGADTGIANATGTGGLLPYSYIWNNGQTGTSATGLIAGTYTVTVTDINGCQDTGQIALSEPFAAIEIVASSTPIQCDESETGAIDITVTGGTEPYDFQWSNGLFTEDLADLDPGIYTVTVTDVNGCTAEATAVVGVTGLPELDIFSRLYPNGFNVSSYQGSDGSIDLTVMSGEEPYTFIWSNGATTEDISGLMAGEYFVTVTDANNCSATASILITQPEGLAIPSAISPNGDGDNDTFVVIGIDAFETNEFEVVNRWGNSVFKVQNYDNTWNGVNMSGEPLPDGTYFVRLNIENGTIILTGFVDLRR